MRPAPAVKRPTVATDALDGGEWVLIGMRKVWRRAASTRALPPIETPTPVQYPPRYDYDVSQLRACTTCPALITERCVSVRTGRVRSSGPHAGRLVSRRCRCGAIPVAMAVQCPACAFEKWSAA